MSKHLFAAAVAAGALSFSLLSFTPAHALSMSECSTKYKAAQSAGTLNGMKWNDFRKAECGANATAAPAAAPAPAAAAAVASLESESMTTSSSTSGTSSTSERAIAPTTPATVRSSFFAGMTTLIVSPSCCLAASSRSGGQSCQRDVRRPNQARVLSSGSRPAFMTRPA